MSDESTETQTTETEEGSSSAAPWAADVEAAFEDEDIRNSVNEFLGQKVQPYVTKVEQEARPNRDATRLWEGFSQEPVETSIQVVKEIYGADIADQFAQLLQAGKSPEEAAAEVEVPSDEGESTDSRVKFEDLPPEVQNAVAEQEQEKQREAYYAEIDRITKERADELPTEGEGDDAKPKLDVDLFHPFVVAANGDFDQAADAYVKWLNQAKESFGIQVPGTESVETPPATINSETRDASAKPPQNESYDSLDDAMDAFFDEVNAPPPTVGTA